MLWITLGLTTLAQGEQFRLLQLNFENYPQLAQIITYLFALFAVVQGYWFAKQRGFVPYIGPLFFLFITLYIGSNVTNELDQATNGTDWITLFLLILTIISLLGCRVKSSMKSRTDAKGTE